MPFLLGGWSLVFSTWTPAPERVGSWPSPSPAAKPNALIAAMSRELCLHLKLGVSRRRAPQPLAGSLPLHAGRARPRWAGGSLQSGSGAGGWRPAACGSGNTAASVGLRAPFLALSGTECRRGHCVPFVLSGSAARHRAAQSHIHRDDPIPLDNSRTGRRGRSRRHHHTPRHGLRVSTSSRSHHRMSSGMACSPCSCNRRANGRAYIGLP